jgi:hypothetical protein
MSIQLTIPGAQAGAAGAASFSDARVARILNASTLGEAQRMGLFDRISDWWRGGVKADAIRQIYDQVSAPRSDQSAPTDMLQRFQRLRSLASDNHQAAFFVAQHQGLGEQGNQWGFSLNLAGTQVYHSGPLDETPAQSSTRFRDQLTLYEGLNKTVACFRRTASAMAGTLNSPDRLPGERIDCMADHRSGKDFLHQNLDNPVLSRRHFKGFEDDVPGVSFRAVFQREGEEPVKLTLSDRPGTNNEYRAQTLRDALQGENYGTLRELLSRGHLTRDDQSIFYALGAATGDLHDAIRSVMGNDEANPEQMFAFVRDQSPVDNPYFELLRAERFGAVSLMDICFQKSIPEADQLQRFDKAREQLKGDWADALVPATRQAQAQLDLAERSGLRSEATFVIDNTQDAVDDPDDRAGLVDRLDDPVFCAAHFVGIEPGATDATFRAVFRPEGAEADSIEFSNRLASNREMRGDTLKAMLQSGGYSNLRELLGQGYLGAGDPIVGGAVNGVLQQTLVDTLGFSRADDLKPFLMHLRDHGPADLAGRTFEALRNTAIARTNLLEVLMGADAPAPQLPQAPVMIPAHLLA